MDAGIKLTDEDINEFTNNLKFKPQYRALVLGADANKGEVYKIETLPKDFNYADLYAEGSAHLPQKEARFIIYDFEYEKDSMKKSDLILVAWIPSKAPPKIKFVGATVISTIKNQLQGIKREFNCDDVSQLHIDSITSGMK